VLLETSPSARQSWPCSPWTETGRRLDDRVEHGLDAFRTRDRAEDFIQCLTLLAQVRVLPDELFDVERLAATHPADSRPTARASPG
jgi:hypothetical protein